MGAAATDAAELPWHGCCRIRDWWLTSPARPAQLPCRFLSEATGLTQEQVEQECDREQFCSPQRAVELGLIDGIVECGP